VDDVVGSCPSLQGTDGRAGGTAAGKMKVRQRKHLGGDGRGATPGEAL